MKILYVEDEKVMRDIFVPMIKLQAGRDPVVATSGNEAINILKNDPHFDLIISDYMMSNGTGDDLLSFISKEMLTIPFILFSNTLEPKISQTHEQYLGMIFKTKSDQLLLKIQSLL